MATEQQLIEGIRRADAAGDSEGVKVLGRQLVAMRSAPKAVNHADKKTSNALGFAMEAKRITDRLPDPIQAAFHAFGMNAPGDQTRAKVQERAQLMSRVSKGASSRGGALGALDAFGRGVADLASFGTADKISAGLNAVAPLDRLAGRDVASVWDNGGDLVGAFKKNLAGEQRIDAVDQRVNPNARLAGQVVGGVLGPVPGRGLIAKAAGKLGKSAPLARIVGEGVAQSGAYGLGRGDSTDVTQRLRNAVNDAALGGAGALVGAGVVRGAGRLISPIVDPSVRKLANAGITMTPGQRGGRIARFVEQASESIPIIREPIKAAKARGVEQFNKAWINEGLAPIGAKLPKGVSAGYASIEFAQDAVSKAYDKALAKISAPVDEPFAQGLRAVAEKASQMPKPLADAFNYTMNQEIAPLISGKAQIDGPTLQRVNRLLQSRISKLQKSNDGLSDILADNLDEVRQNFLGLASRHSGQGAREFQAANAAHANLSRVYDAAARPQSVGGVFTPSTAASAAARKGYGTSVNNLSTGSARMQELADAAKSVLPDTLPNSGTADRAAWITGIGALGSGAGASVNPALAIPGAGLAQYIPGVDTALQKFSLRGQSDQAKFLADEIRKRAYIGGMFGAPVAVQSGN